jgi:Zn-dependent protease/predicted transcriptional regulator
MNPTLRLGRIFGIEVGFNWSLVFVFILVAWSLATALPTQVPGRPSAEYWTAGVIGAVAFYAGLLAHELSHSLLARRYGVRVRGITLWLFGGVSQLEGEPERPAWEAAITAVGPLTSLLVAVLCYVLGLAVFAVGGLRIVAYVLIWLAYINLILGLFNLIPAFPLDGGRLLGALLWWQSGSRQRGVHRAVQVGRLFAYAMIALGFVELFLGSVLNGVWIAFLGWFLLSAASAEESGAVAHEALRSLPVSAAMTSPAVTIPDWITVEQFIAEVAHGHPFTTYPTHDPQGAVTGVVRLQDLVRWHARDQRQQRLRDIVTPIAEMPRARPDEDLNSMLDRVGADLQKRVLVYDGEQLVGIVSPADIARLVQQRRSAAASAGR